MITVLVAEDEKLIRKGIAAMVGRSSLNPDAVLEARDGLEAWEILERQPVEVLITDIRMPQLDGIALVERSRRLPNPPLVLVISGYDDFSYAVSMLRSGVQDYLLKPVETDKFNAAMDRLTALLAQRQCQQRNRREHFLLHLSYLMERPDADPARRDAALREVETQFFRGTFQAVCAREEAVQVPEDTLSLRGPAGIWVYLVPQAQQVRGERVVGESGCHQGVRELHQAYQEAYGAWKQCFFTGGRGRYAPASNTAAPPKAEHLLDLIRLSRWQEALKLLEESACQVGRGELEAEALGNVCQAIAEGLAKTYRDLYEADETPLQFQNLWRYPCWDSYVQELTQWMELFCQRLDQEFADYESKQKIRDAVQYIRQNFRGPINMAMVSNHVSMNYSLFSVFFKQYTGTNFVSFLQTLRLEEAQRLLRETDLRVNEISAKAGFSGEKHFLKVFKAATGVSPSDWRRLNRMNVKHRGSKD